jgi:prepilin-type N-terminal cleavage/methylation domain-containing protein
MDRRGYGFSLIELLVVIAIIALLVTILMPTLNRAKELARQAICATNLRSIGVGLMMYESEHHHLPDRGDIGWLHPHVVYRPPNKADLRGLLLEYCGSKGMFYCPENSDGRTAESNWPEEEVTTSITYHVPGWLNPEGYADSQWLIPDPEDPLRPQMPLAVDMVGERHDGLRLVNHADEGGWPGGMNELYGDGHVSWEHAGEQADWTAWCSIGPAGPLGWEWYWAKPRVD